MRASSSPIPTARISVTRSEMLPRAGQNDSFPNITTRAPSTSVTGEL